VIFQFFGSVGIKISSVHVDVRFVGRMVGVCDERVEKLLGLQSTRILAGFLRVAAASSAESVHARGWSKGMRFCVKSPGREGYCTCSGFVR